MKKTLLILALVLFYSCKNTPTESPNKIKTNYDPIIFSNGDEILKIEWQTRSITYSDGKGEPICFHLNEDSGRYLGIKGGNLIIENGFISAENGIYKKVVTTEINNIKADQIRRWRGELYDDPGNGRSGDEYYNMSTGEIKIFISSRNQWVAE